MGQMKSEFQRNAPFCILHFYSFHCIITSKMPKIKNNNFGNLPVRDNVFS